MEKHTEQEIIRRNSLEKIKEKGINPYPAEEYIINTNSVEIKSNFSPGETAPKGSSIAGRIMGHILGRTPSGPPPFNPNGPLGLKDAS